MLGLGLGLNKGGNLLSNLKLLTRNSDWAIWADKATGTSKGTNSPQVNPIVDLVGNADGTLTGFAFTGASGYVDVVAPNGKTVTGIQGDGVNDVIVLPSNAPNPVGLQDFGFAFAFKTPAVFGSNGWFIMRNNLSGADAQWGLVFNSILKTLALNLEGVEVLATQTNSLVVNSFYKLIVKRKNGQLTMNLNGVIVSVANSTNLTFKPNTRIFARSNDAGGTTHSLFNNFLLLCADYNNGTDIDAWEADQNKSIAKIYGL